MNVRRAQKIRIRLQAFDRRLLDTSCEKIVDT
ncbi:MAG: 30S ribosomal protein S10, partial [Cyanobacteria bacterium J06639_18]